MSSGLLLPAGERRKQQMLYCCLYLSILVLCIFLFFSAQQRTSVADLQLGFKTFLFPLSLMWKAVLFIVLGVGYSRFLFSGSFLESIELLSMYAFSMFVYKVLSIKLSYQEAFLAGFV